MPSAPQRILIIKPSSLGDIVHALPVLAGLRRAHPRARVSWLIGSGFADLLAGHPLIDELIPFDRGRFGRMWRSPRIAAEFLAFVRSIRARRFDLVIDLQGLFRSGFLARASGAARRVGFADARELATLFYTDRVRCGADAVHAVDRNLCVSAALALPPTAEFPLPVDAGALARARAMLGATPDDPPILAIVVGARWVTKIWPAERGGELLAAAVRDGRWRAVLLGAPADRTLADALLSSAARLGSDCRDVIDLVGRTTLRELTALMSLSRVVVCQDSGPMHVAAALGRPTVALFGPTDERRTGPYSSAARVVRVELECAPCRRRRCRFAGADPRHHRCMRDISAARVIAEIEAAAQQSGR